MIKSFFCLVLLATVAFSTDNSTSSDGSCPTNRVLDIVDGACNCGDGEISTNEMGTGPGKKWCRLVDLVPTIENLENEFDCATNVLLDSDAIYSNGGVCICGTGTDKDITPVQMGPGINKKWCKEVNNVKHSKNLETEFDCPTNVLLDINAAYSNGGACSCGENVTISVNQIGAEFNSKYCEEVNDVKLVHFIVHRFNCPADTLLDSNAVYSNGGSCICGQGVIKIINVEQMNAGTDKKWCEEEDDETKHLQNLGTEFDCPTDVVLDSNAAYSNGGSCICGIRATKEITASEMGTSISAKQCKAVGIENMIQHLNEDEKSTERPIYIWTNKKGECVMNSENVCAQPITILCIKIKNDNVIGTVSQINCDQNSKPSEDDVECEDTSVCELVPIYQWKSEMGSCTLNNDELCVKPVTVTCYDSVHPDIIRTVSNDNCEDEKPSDDDIECPGNACKDPIYVWKEIKGSCTFTNAQTCVQPVTVTCIDSVTHGKDSVHENLASTVSDYNCNGTRPSSENVECPLGECAVPRYEWKLAPGICNLNATDVCVQPITATCTDLLYEDFVGTVSTDNCDDTTEQYQENVECDASACATSNYQWKSEKGVCTRNAIQECVQPVTVTCSILEVNRISVTVGIYNCQDLTMPSEDDIMCEDSACGENCVGRWSSCDVNCIRFFVIDTQSSGNGTDCAFNDNDQGACEPGAGDCTGRRDLFEDHTEVHSHSDLPHGYFRNKEMRSYFANSWARRN